MKENRKENLNMEQFTQQHLLQYYEDIVETMKQIDVNNSCIISLQKRNDLAQKQIEISMNNIYNILLSDKDLKETAEKMLSIDHQDSSPHPLITELENTLHEKIDDIEIPRFTTSENFFDLTQEENTHETI